MHIISTRRENNLGCKNANQTKRGQNEKQNINTRTCEPIWCIQRKHRKNGGPITKPACRNCVQSCTRTGVARCGFDWRRWWIGGPLRRAYKKRRNRNEKAWRSNCECYISEIQCTESRRQSDNPYFDCTLKRRAMYSSTFRWFSSDSSS